LVKEEIMAKNLKITLVKSKIGQVPKNVKIVNAMGLHKINSTVVLPDNASVRGMIQKVNHMINVEEVEA
jgi:large subunit ribosomal protein L30